MLTYLDKRALTLLKVPNIRLHVKLNAANICMNLPCIHTYAMHINADLLATLKLDVLAVTIVFKGKLAAREAILLPKNTA